VSTPTIVQMRKKRMSKRRKCRRSFWLSTDAARVTVSEVAFGMWGRSYAQATVPHIVT
jgi:hypothetical protein